MRLSTLSPTDPARQDALEHIRGALHANLDDIAAKIHQPTLQSWNLWIRGPDEGDEVTLGVHQASQAPNPEAFGDEWLVILRVWDDPQGVDADDPEDVIQETVHVQLRDHLDDMTDEELAQKAQIFGRAAQPRSLPGGERA